MSTESTAWNELCLRCQYLTGAPASARSILAHESAHARAGLRHTLGSPLHPAHWPTLMLPSLPASTLGFPLPRDPPCILASHPTIPVQIRPVSQMPALLSFLRKAFPSLEHPRVFPYILQGALSFPFCDV